MTIIARENGIALIGECRVEDAETLLQKLRDAPDAPIDIAACGRLHMAILQVLLAAGRPVRGVPGDPFLQRWLLPLLHGHARKSGATDRASDTL